VSALLAKIEIASGTLSASIFHVLMQIATNHLSEKIEVLVHGVRVLRQEFFCSNGQSRACPPFAGSERRFSAEAV
jgi:hypothetical protein